jgi:hypothetical protein
VHQHPDPSPALLHHYALRRVLEPPLPHQLEEQRRVLAPGVGEDGLAARREQLGHEIREGRSAPSLVEHVGGENQVEGPEPLHVGRVPVEERGLRFPAQVRPGVVDREVEGGFVVVSRENFCATREGGEGGEPDAAAELDGAPAGQVSARERAGQGDRARPEVGPVGEPLVALEISLVYEGVGRGGVQDAVGFVYDLDDGFEEPGAAAEVRP